MPDFNQIAALARQILAMCEPSSAGPIYPKLAPTAWLYQPIPPGAPLNAKSALYTAELQRQLSVTTKNMGANIYSYSAPIFNPKPGTPLVTVAALDYIGGDGTNYGTLQGLQDAWAAVPLADYMVPSAGTDGELVIFDPASDSLWEFWAMDRAKLTALRGGGMTKVSENPGAWTGNTGFGITATGLIYSSLQVTVDELFAGEIKHAIGLMVQYAAFYPQYSWPAQRTDGWWPVAELGDAYAASAIPEGLRGLLDPTADLSGCTPIAQTVGKCLKTYGFVISDKTGGTPAIRFENPLSRTAVGLPDPYPALLNGVEPYDVFKGFPWDKLKWLPVEYHS